MKTNIKIFSIFSFLLSLSFLVTSVYADNINYGYRSPGSYPFIEEGENDVTVCNNVRCATTTYRIDRTAPQIISSWTQPEINFDSLLEVRAVDNVSMVGGNLVVTQDGDKFDIQPALILGKEAIITITVKPQFISDIFTTNFTVTATDHMGHTSTAQLGVYSVHYDGQAPIIDVSANNGGTSTQQGFLSSAYASNESGKIRISDGSQEAELTDDYGFLVDVEEKTDVPNSAEQTGIYELAYRYSVDPESYPTELPDSIQESDIQNLGLTSTQANTLWEKRDASTTLIQFKAGSKKELLENCVKLGLNVTQQQKIINLWKKIWQEAFYKVPNINTSLETLPLNQQVQIHSYIQLPETGKVLLEIQAIDKAGNIESKIFNIHLDTRPIVQVSPLEWINPSKGEKATIKVLDKSDLNPFYTDNTYLYVLKAYNNGILGAEQFKISSSEKEISLGDQLKSFAKGVYGLEVYYKDNSGYQSSQFVGNLYIDNSDVVQPKDLTYTLDAPSKQSAGLNTIAPVENACPSSVKFNAANKNGIKKIFTNCIPEFKIPDIADKKGRSDLISYNITQLAKMNDKKELELYRSEKADASTTVSGLLNLLVFDTHNTSQISEFSEEDMSKTDTQTKGDILRITTKDSAANRAQSMYQKNVMDPLLNVISTSENGGTEAFAEAIDPLEAQKKTIQTSMDNGFSKVSDSKGSLVVSNNDVKPVSFLTNVAQKKYESTLLQLENLLKNNQKSELTLTQLKQDEAIIDKEIDKVQEQNQAFLDKVQPKRVRLAELVTILQGLRTQEKELYAQFNPYMGTEQQLLNAQNQLANTNSRYQSDMNNLVYREQTLPGVISQDRAWLQQLQYLQDQYSSWWWGWEWGYWDWGYYIYGPQIASLQQTIASNEAYLRDIPRLRQELPKKYALDKTRLENQIKEYQQKLAIKKGLENQLQAKKEEITIKVVESDTLTKEIAELENNLAKSINPVGLSEMKIEKQKVTSKIQKQEKIISRNESFIENSKRNLYSFGKQIERSSDIIVADIQSVYDKLSIYNKTFTTSKVASGTVAGLTSDTGNTTTEQIPKEVLPMKISSKSFQEGGAIPTKFTCDGDNVNPSLSISGVPAEAKSLAIIFENESKTASLWNIWDINPQTYSIPENSIPSGGIQGVNLQKLASYTGPCPAISGQQSVQFTLLALDIKLSLAEGTQKSVFITAMEGHTLATATLALTYDRTLQIQKTQIQQELKTLNDSFSADDSALEKEIAQLSQGITVKTQEKEQIASDLANALQNQAELITQKEDILAKENTQQDQEKGLFDSIISVFTSGGLTKEEIDSALAGIDIKIDNYKKQQISLENEINDLKNKKDPLEKKRQIAKEEYDAKKQDLESQLNSVQNSIQEKILLEQSQNQGSSTISQLIDSLLGIQSTYAAALPEGVYELPNGTQIVVDLTNPTGDISALTENNGNANTDPTSGWAFKPGANQKLAIKKNDNFEQYGSFKSWKVEGKKGSHPKDMMNPCGNFGAYKLVDDSSKYPDPLYGSQIVEDKIVATANNWGECFQYKLTVEDESGHIFTKDSEVVYADGILPELTSWSIQDGNKKDFALESQKSCADCEAESAWSKVPLTINWDFADKQSGIASMNMVVIRNGVAITGLPAMTAQGSYTIPSDKEGYYAITFTVIDKAGNTLIKKFVLKYDKTPAALSWANSLENNVSGFGDAQLAGIGTWNFGYDDLNNGNSSSNSNANYVAQTMKSDISIKISKCLDDTCTTINTLSTISGNTIDESDTNWVDILDSIDWADQSATNSISNKRIELKHSKYFGGNATGKYTITYDVIDRAGNTSNFSKTITVEPNQMNSTNSTLTPEASCNNGSWKADASDICTTKVVLKDQYQNPLYNRKDVHTHGKSDTSFDQIHMPNPDNDDNYEGLFFSLNNIVDTEAKGIRIPNTFTTTTDGSFTFDMVTYAPTWNKGEVIDFVIATKSHTAMDYASGGSGNYTVTDQENNKAYKAGDSIHFVWASGEPTFFQKNATKNFSVNITNTTLNATNERIGLYIYDKLTGAYTLTNMDTTGPKEESKSTWIPGNDTTEKTNAQNALSIGSYNYDAAVIYSIPDMNGNYEYKIRFSKNSGVQDFDTTVNIAPFARMTITRGAESKEVAYPLMNNMKKDIPLYNQATEVTGAGMVQSSIGQSSQTTGTDAAKDSAGSISIQAFTSDLKEKVKKEILNLKSQTADQSIRTLTNFDAGVQRINNGQTYVVKGDNADLVITGDAGTLSIGDNPVTFITFGGNIIVKANIIYSGVKQPTVAFISLRNEATGQGGEIHVFNTTSTGTPLTNIVGSYFSERGVLGVDNTDKTNLTEQERQTELTHQLVILGSVVGGNTLGGGDSPYACPSFIRQAQCTVNEADLSALNIPQKYDINYLRRYVPTGDANHVPASNNGGSTKPVIIQYYLNRELLPEELQ